MNGIEMREKGLAVRMRFIGEKIDYRGSWIRASINRLPEADPVPGIIPIQTEQGATIVIPHDQDRPKRGEIITDERGIEFRVHEWKWVAHGWWILAMANHGQG